MSSERGSEHVDARLEELFPADAEPLPGAEGAAVAVALALFARRRARMRWLRVAAALVLLAAGFAAGSLLKTGEEVAPDEVLPTTLAEHELSVFEAVRESIGQDLAWLATHEGEVILGLGNRSPDVPLRVVFVEIRGRDGESIAQTRLVLPEGREVRIAPPDAPELTVSATRDDDGGLVKCAVAFADGARLESPGTRVTAGRKSLLGRVRTDGETVSVYVAAF